LKPDEFCQSQKTGPIPFGYTSQAKPYHRAPHFLIGIPTRNTDRGWSDSMKALPEPAHRELRGDASALAGKSVRLLFVLEDADVFAFQFLP
jgi:hypothetical protein